MNRNPSVNRYLKDKSMDHIDHALGRPVDPMGETYRNHFATGVDSQEAKAFGASENWELDGLVRGMAYFSVTDAGRKALADHLTQIGDKHRLYDVTYEGQTQAVVALSAAKAVGQFVLPPAKTRAPSTARFGAAGVCDPSKVYVSTDAGGAMIYAAVHFSGRGKLYEVEPVGELKPDPDARVDGLSFACDRARVLRVIRLKGKTIKRVQKIVMEDA
ncbi:hypothetical protein [Ensifer adhaerens]|jgi:hypothetical protein|uniref:hypothetical protein n=1 Tax=Ensifer adhaerens TaxID=106592 RepID=UPI00202E925B|nr:hypothetical protein [Ensifer adhaerens]